MSLISLSKTKKMSRGMWKGTSNKEYSHGYIQYGPLSLWKYTYFFFLNFHVPNPNPTKKYSNVF